MHRLAAKIKLVSMKKIIIIKTDREIIPVHVDKIIVIYTEGGCSTLSIDGGVKHHTAKGLKYFKEHRIGYFCQLNRNIIVNMNYVEKISIRHKKVVLKDGRSFAISVRRMKELRSFIKENYEMIKDIDS